MKIKAGDIVVSKYNHFFNDICKGDLCLVEKFFEDDEFCDFSLFVRGQIIDIHYSKIYYESSDEFGVLENEND